MGTTADKPCDSLAALCQGQSRAACSAQYRHDARSHDEPHFTLSHVALNDTIMVFAFAPIVGLLLGLSAIAVP